MPACWPSAMLMRRCILGLLIIIGAIIQGSCSQPRVVVVTLAGALDALASVQVRTSLANQAGNAISVEPKPSPFVIALPDGGVGLLRLNAAGFSADAGCNKMAIGEASVDVNEQTSFPIFLTVHMTRLSSPVCQITVDFTYGTGSIQSNPLGISCTDNDSTRCQADFAPGTLLTLSGTVADPGLRPYLSWSDNCTAQSETTCSFNLAKSEKITVIAAQRDCSDDGWCLYEPPSGAPSLSVWGSAANDVWVVGQNGSIRHYDGRRWTRVSSPTKDNLLSIWGSAANDIWAVGANAAILHWDGQLWSSMKSPLQRSWRRVWGIGTTTVWLIAADGTVVNWNGSDWLTRANSSGVELRGLWGSGPDDIWIVGTNCTILHWNGTFLNKLQSYPGDLCQGNQTDFLFVWGIDRDTVYLSGTKATLLKYDTDTMNWNKVDTVSTKETITSIWGSGRTDVWAVTAWKDIIHFDGMTWSNVITQEARVGDYHQYYDIWGSGKDDAWVTAYSGRLLHWNGKQWSALAQFDHNPQLVASVSGSSATDIWAVSKLGACLHWSGYGWTEVDLTSVNPEQRELYGIWSSSSQDVWIVGDAGLVIHYDGKKWSKLEVATTNYLVGIWGRDSNNIWFAGSGGVIYKWDGTKISSTSVPGLSVDSEVYRIFGFSNSVFATANETNPSYGNGTLWRTDNGSTWMPVLLNDSGGTDVRKSTDRQARILRGIWGTSPSELYVVGSRGLIVHGVGAPLVWSQISNPVGGEYFAVTGNSANDVWFIGSSFLHWDGVGMGSPPAPTLSRPPTDFWCFGIWHPPGIADYWSTCDFGVIQRHQP
jgi:hypothetical protein